ncbi:hypothetical protein B0H13DRAFT_2437942 [Mycena leptocephala]|nr:hypothetical protein B0H13DRAFT_2437942 [Mycena leptocephala]
MPCWNFDVLDRRKILYPVHDTRCSAVARTMPAYRLRRRAPRQRMPAPGRRRGRSQHRWYTPATQRRRLSHAVHLPTLCAQPQASQTPFYTYPLDTATQRTPVLACVHAAPIDLTAFLSLPLFHNHRLGARTGSPTSPVSARTTTSRARTLPRRPPQQDELIHHPPLPCAALQPLLASVGFFQPAPHSTSGTSHRRWYALCDTTTSRLTRRALPRPLRPNPTVLHRLHPVPRSAPHRAHAHVDTAPPSPCAACAALPTQPQLQQEPRQAPRAPPAPLASAFACAIDHGAAREYHDIPLPRELTHHAGR